MVLQVSRGRCALCTRSPRASQGRLHIADRLYLLRLAGTERGSSPRRLPLRLHLRSASRRYKNHPAHHPVSSAPPQMPSIYDFPEELLEHVIALCVAVSPIPSPPTSPSWHTRTFLTRRTSPLLVSKAFNRIGTPLMYNAINITNPTQAELLLRTLRENPSISPLIHSLVISSITIHSAQALSLCRNLVLLDFALDAGSQPPLPATAGPREPVPEPDVVEFSKALSNVMQLRHLVVRKSSAGVYLTTPRVKHMLCYLAEALPHWDELVSNCDRA